MPLESVIQYYQDANRPSVNLTGMLSQMVQLQDRKEDRERAAEEFSLKKRAMAADERRAEQRSLLEREKFELEKEEFALRQDAQKKSTIMENARKGTEGYLKARTAAMSKGPEVLAQFEQQYPPQMAMRMLSLLDPMEAAGYASQLGVQPLGVQEQVMADERVARLKAQHSMENIQNTMVYDPKSKTYVPTGATADPTGVPLEQRVDKARAERANRNDARVTEIVTMASTGVGDGAPGGFMMELAQLVGQDYNQGGATNLDDGLNDQELGGAVSLFLSHPEPSVARIRQSQATAFTAATRLANGDETAQADLAEVMNAQEVLKRAEKDPAIKNTETYSLAQAVVNGTPENAFNAAMRYIRTRPNTHPAGASPFKALARTYEERWEDYRKVLGTQVPTKTRSRGTMLQPEHRKYFDWLKDKGFIR